MCAGGRVGARGLLPPESARHPTQGQWSQQCTPLIASLSEESSVVARLTAEVARASVPEVCWPAFVSLVAGSAAFAAGVLRSFVQRELPEWRCLRQGIRTAELLRLPPQTSESHGVQTEGTQRHPQPPRQERQHQHVQREAAGPPCGAPLPERRRQHHATMLTVQRRLSTMRRARSPIQTRKTPELARRAGHNQVGPPLLVHRVRKSCRTHLTVQSGTWPRELRIAAHRRMQAYVWNCGRGSSRQKLVVRRRRSPSTPRLRRSPRRGSLPT